MSVTGSPPAVRKCVSRWKVLSEPPFALSAVSGALAIRVIVSGGSGCGATDARSHRPEHRIPRPVGDAKERVLDVGVAAVHLQRGGPVPGCAVARQRGERRQQAMLDGAGRL